jgi:hypothetical protein
VDISTANLTLAGDGASATSIIDGRVKVAATGVTVKGFRILGADAVAAEGTNGIYVVGGSNGLTVSDNDIDGTNRVSPARGVHFEVGGTTGVTITNNVIENWNSSGTFFNPTAGPVSVTLNDYLNNNVGIGSDGLGGATVNNNEFSGNTAEAFGLGTPVAGNVVHENNFVPAGIGNDVNWYTSGSTVDATNNWWDSEADGSRTNNTTDVDVTSPAGAAFLHN